MSLSRYTPIAFSEWSALNQEDLRKKFARMHPWASENPAKVECSGCEGEGYQTCDMGHEHDCPECDGTGEGETEYDLFTLGEYHEQVRLDKERAKRYELSIA